MFWRKDNNASHNKPCKPWNITGKTAFERSDLIIFIPKTNDHEIQIF